VTPAPAGPAVEVEATPATEEKPLDEPKKPAAAETPAPESAGAGAPAPAAELALDAKEEKVEKVEKKPEWPRVVVGYVEEVREAPVKGNPKYTSVTIARLGGGTTVVNGVEVPPGACELWESQWLRIAPEYTPADLEDERLLVCGPAGLTTYSGWAAITDGSVTFVVDSSSYEADDLDFSACVSMDDVARVIETGWRTAQDYNRNFVRWAEAGTNKFLLTTASGEISYLTAGTSGTDISGAGHMNGLTGGTGVSIAPVLEVTAALQPAMRTDTLPDWFLTRYGSTIAALATYILARQRGSATAPNPYYNPELAALRLSEYRDGMQIAATDVAKRGGAALEPLL
jgi:hypothetical protein